MLISNTKYPYNVLSFVSDSLVPTLEIVGFYSLYSSVVSTIQPSHFFRFAQSPSRQVCIIRGIGYRVQLLNNYGVESNIHEFTSNLTAPEKFSSSFSQEILHTGNESDWSAINTYEFPSARYLSLRVGHSDHLYFPVPNFLGIKISKKDRKLVVYGFSLQHVSTFTKFIYSWRPPSVYTGRGIRYKKSRPRRKLGKKDIRKGRFF